MAEGKPSFFSTTLSGITGSIKGALTGLAVGAALGAAIGATIAVATVGFGIPALLGGAILGAQYVGIPMGVIGAMSGTMTGVVTSREQGSPTAGDMMNVAKMAYSQGVSVGRQMEQEQGKGQESTKWRDRYAQEQAAKATDQGQTIH